MHLLAARVGDHNAVVISQKTLAQIAQASRRGVQNALKVLADERWLEVIQIGATGSVNGYVLNDRVVWHGPRDGLRYSKFSAMVIVTDEDQPNRKVLGRQGPLQQVPRVFPEEQQLPTGPGLPPPSEPALPGLEPEMPAIEERRGEPTSFGSLLEGLMPSTPPEE
jgi:DNA-binding transcriptional MocR family regulator